MDQKTRNLPRHSICYRFLNFALLIIFGLGIISPLGTASAQVSFPAPEPLSPIPNGVTITATEPTLPNEVAYPPVAIPEFSWNKVPGATQYTLQVARDIGFTNVSISQNTPFTRFTPVSSSSLPDGDFYWRVKVNTPAPGSIYSTPLLFHKDWATDDNKPTLLDVSTVQYFDSPTFSWEGAVGAAEYRLQISPTQEFTTITYASTNPIVGVPQTQGLSQVFSHQPVSKMANGTYYWRVIPYGPTGVAGTPSTPDEFTLAYDYVPVPLEPAHNSRPTFTPTFKWTAVSGAQKYELDYSTDPTFNANVTHTTTNNTTFTPTATLPNDVDYYWRVRAISGTSVGPWTAYQPGVPWKFRKQWYIKPVLLTPTNNYQFVRFPFFSWTPVPGAAYYKIEYDTEPNFAPPIKSDTTSNPFYTPKEYLGAEDIWYWHVIPFDGSARQGAMSDLFSYSSSYLFLSPEQVYPLYYFEPNTFTGYPAVSMNPYEDRTVALPVFAWKRLTDDFGETPAGAYEVEVFDSGGAPVWSTQTENLTAAPTPANPFNPLTGSDYYWQVCGLSGLGGFQVGQCSQPWRARFDSSLLMDTTSGATPQLLRPTFSTTYDPGVDPGYQMEESIETTPRLEWIPLERADTYIVELSTDPAFAPGFTLFLEEVDIPVFTPSLSYGEKIHSAYQFGTFYWRVQAVVDGVPTDEWSNTWRFEISAQSRWELLRTTALGDSHRISVDSAGEETVEFDLADLYAGQDSDYWYFGFDTDAAANAAMTYALYLDIDRREGSGAVADKRGYDVSFLNFHQPEYAVYIDKPEGGAITGANVTIATWNGSAWTPIPPTLPAVGGSLRVELHGSESEIRYIELKIPNTAIGYNENRGSYSLALISTPTIADSVPVDSLPDLPEFSTNLLLSRFASVTEHIGLLMPPSNLSGDPTTHPSLLPFFYNYAVGAPWSGGNLEAATDPAFTENNFTSQIKSTANWYAPSVFTVLQDFYGDNSYYWRVQSCYRAPNCPSLGSWSQA